MSRTNSKKNSIFKNINRRLFGIFVFLLIMFFVSQIYFTSSVGTKSSEIDDIRREKDILRLENEILLSKIDSARSIDGLDEIAEENNLVEKDVVELRPSRDSDVALGD